MPRRGMATVFSLFEGSIAVTASPPGNGVCRVTFRHRKRLVDMDVVVGLVVVVLALGLLLLGAWRGNRRDPTPPDPRQALKEFRERELIDRLPGPPGR